MRDFTTVCDLALNPRSRARRVLAPNRYHLTDIISTMSRGDRPARFGPFHRRQYADPRENEKIASSGQIWGRPPRNVYAGAIPAVKAWNGPLPEGLAGVEFYTDVEPDPHCPPSSPQWTEGRPGVIILERRELVAIGVVISKRVDQ